MTTAFVDFNGVVPEKFDAVRLSHLVDAEYALMIGAGIEATVAVPNIVILGGR